MQSIRDKHLVLVVALSLWAITVSYGVASLWAYDTKPGVAASAPRVYSKEKGPVAMGDRMLMLVFLHPHCPCSNATLEQLEILLRSRKIELECRVYVVVPPEAVAGWEKGPLLERVHSIPGVLVKYDFGGIETQRFAASTSGQVLLYERNRSLVFSGGITASRGHPGESLGARAILALLENRSTPITVAPVYGCPLLNLGSLCGGVSPCKL